MKPYVVTQGDYLAKLAHALGFDADAVWADPKNADLKNLRDPNLLNPGDVLYVPETDPTPVPIAGGGSNAYVAAIPEISIQLVFKDDDKPRANEPYVVEGLGDDQTGSTDGDGMLELKVPVNLRELRVTFPNKNTVYPVQIGDMDPIDEPSGRRKRLVHLGYLWPLTEELLGMMSDDDHAARDLDALTQFQKAQSLDPTGIADDATKAALVKAHGS